jgi:hypothetical protein
VAGGSGQQCLVPANLSALELACAIEISVDEYLMETLNI